MARRIAIGLLFGFLALSVGLWGQQKKQAPPPPKTQEQQSEPPEEDEALKPKEYSFNPLQAEKELRIGNYYFKKGKYTAAASRFTEATKWNPNFADAFLRLGDAQEKLHDSKAAREAYQKYVDLAPDGKDAEHIKKKLAGRS